MHADMVERLRDPSYDLSIDERSDAAADIERLRVLLHRCLCNLDTDYHAPLIKDIADAGVSHTCGEPTNG